MIESIKLSSLTMRNFMIYEDYTIRDLENYKVIFISGKNAQGKSTLTSESIYYGLFGMPLRYKKISDLLNWNYDPDIAEPAYCNLGLSFNMGDHLTALDIRRNIIDDNNRYDITIENDKNNDLFHLTECTKVKDFNNSIKDLLDVDEKKFSILYLKSPFSEVLFESNSDLLSSITKSQFINELRKEFNDITKDIKLNVNNLGETIEKQNSLAQSIKNQLKAALNQDDVNDDRDKLKKIITEIESLDLNLTKLNTELTTSQQDYRKYENKKNEVIALVSKIETYLVQLYKEKTKLTDLTDRGRCPTCEQLISKKLYSDDVLTIEDKITIYKAKFDAQKELLGKINTGLSTVDKTLADHQNAQRKLNSSIRSLSNMKSKLQSNIDNFKDNKASNNEILKKIRTTIMDLNDDLTGLQTDHKIMSSIGKVMLNKNSEYINKFYDQKIYAFNMVFKSILSKMTKGKFTDVKMKLNNKPTLNGHIQYESLSTSERKFIDISFVISYIVYLSTKLKLRTFILDEFLDNYDKVNILHIYDMIYEIATDHDLQLIITTNMADYLFTYMGDVEDIKIIELE